MTPAPVAIIDIGSNSIKLLVAGAGPEGRPVALRTKTLDARISAGISAERPALAEEGMTRGLAAVQDLLAEAASEQPRRIVLAATSAVRDAANGAEFRARVQAATGHAIRILTGDEEANLIGRGLACDPALAGLRDFYLFDLGGGSLECLAFRERRAVREVSLRLGCVRLTEKFVPDPAAPFPAAAGEAIARHTREAFAAASFAFSLPPGASVIGTGGTLTNVRATAGARQGLPLEATGTLLPVAELRAMLAWLGALPLAERRGVPGLPPARADVFPAALATLIAVAELGGFAAYRHSLYNLRWGLAAEELGL
ncbi:MAG TPA: phosphatase [Opitutaceae bacterium]|jgi:exopolyphosphatase/guanosine-5'-triphosphate,3'-diphosphate pyrophosphatase|nr:phosphatase [Opitutaceae bacterium]